MLLKEKFGLEGLDNKVAAQFAWPREKLLEPTVSPSSYVYISMSMIHIEMF